MIQLASTRIRRIAALLTLILQILPNSHFASAFLSGINVVTNYYSPSTSRTSVIRVDQVRGKPDLSLQCANNHNKKQQESICTHFLILPGFGNDSSDYIMPQSLVSSLASRATTYHPYISPDRIHVLPVQRTDWLTVFLRGVCDVDFWRSDMAPTRPSFAWYLDRIYNEVNRIVAEQGSSQAGVRQENVKVVLLGHSAGGWLARCVCVRVTCDASTF